MLDLFDKITETADFIRTHWRHPIEYGIVLGSGLGPVADLVTERVVIPYRAVPNFPVSTVIGHKGQLVLGRIHNRSVMIMQGRFHAYEGYPQKLITLPVRIMKALGAHSLIVTNASGGLNPRIRQGELMLIDDHINLMWDNPLVGINDDRLGPRFPDMSRPYCPKMIARALEVARQQNIIAHVGVYVAGRGPNYEPRSEYRMLRQIGADVVGMSTVPEVIVAVHAGLKVMGMSIVSNVCAPESLTETKGEEVVQVVEQAAGNVAAIVAGVIDAA